VSPFRFASTSVGGVSVCSLLLGLRLLTSTMCASCLPTTSWYHFHTSAAIGSPTDPRTRSFFICCLTWWSPALFNSRSAVGAT